MDMRLENSPQVDYVTRTKHAWITSRAANDLMHFDNTSQVLSSYTKFNHIHTRRPYDAWEIGCFLVFGISAV